MKVFLIIVLCILLLPVAFIVVALVVNVFLLVTGRMTKEELAVKCKAYNEEKRKKKEQQNAKNAIIIDVNIDNHSSLPEPVRRALNS